VVVTSVSYSPGTILSDFFIGLFDFIKNSFVERVKVVLIMFYYFFKVYCFQIFEDVYILFYYCEITKTTTYEYILLIKYIFSYFWLNLNVSNYTIYITSFFAVSINVYSNCVVLQVLIHNDAYKLLVYKKKLS
jgi:hypothetical protein